MEGEEPFLGDGSSRIRFDDDDQSQLTAGIEDEKDFEEGAPDEDEGDDEEEEEEEESGLITIETVRRRALKLADLTFDEAFEIDADDHPLHKRIGEFTLIRLGEILYEHIYKDTDLQVECAFKANLKGGKNEIEVLHVQRGTLKIGQIVMGNEKEIPSMKDGAEEDTFIEGLPEGDEATGIYVLSQPVNGTKKHTDVQLGGFGYGPFRSLFANRTKDDLAMEFTDFLTQRLGGETNYKYNHEDRGHNASSLMAMHYHLRIDIPFAKRWLNHMDQTLEDLENDIDAETRRKLRNFFKYSAFFLVVCTQVKDEMIARKTYDFPMNEKYTNIYKKAPSGSNSVASSDSRGQRQSGT